MAEIEKTGTVTPLNSLFTSEEAENAARAVDDAIAERHKEIHRINDFLVDNSALIHHVQKLPDELSHDIMVPFGGAAFFPGRLIHTNEFMVLLGEGYYAEKSAKQTVEFLQRRGKSLEAHLESLNRIIKDLDAEAKFFESTAAEIAEGLVEIREEYDEEIQTKKTEKESAGISSTNFTIPSKVHNFVVSDDENEDAKLMARLDELEKEEEEIVSDFGQDEYYETTSSSHIDEDEDEDGEDEEDDEDENDENEDEDANVNAEDDSETDDEATDPGTFLPTYLPRNAGGLLHHSSYQSSVSGSKVQVLPGGSSESIVVQPYTTQNPPPRLETKEYPPKSPNSSIQNSSERISSQISNTSSTESKAFTGAVIEHSHGLVSASDSASVQPSRPVSRFKMQRGNR